MDGDGCHDHPIYQEGPDLTIYIPEPRPGPSYPPLNVLPKPGGITRFPRPLLIKPDCTFNEIIQGLMGDAKPILPSLKPFFRNGKTYLP